MPCTYLAHHELESVKVVTIIATTTTTTAIIIVVIIIIITIIIIIITITIVVKITITELAADTRGDDSYKGCSGLSGGSTQRD